MKFTKPLLTASMSLFLVLLIVVLTSAVYSAPAVRRDLIDSQQIVHTAQEIQEAPLNGKTIVINPGHGWYWTGTEWVLQRNYYFGIVEDFITPDIAKYLDELLVLQGATVYSTRELNFNAGDGVSGNPKWQEASRYYLEALGVDTAVWNSLPGGGHRDNDIRARPLYANSIGADLLVSIHTNGGGGTGTETWYDSSNAQAAQSLNLATSMHNKVIEFAKTYDPNWTDRAIKEAVGNDSKGELRLAQMPTALVEVAFHDTETPDNDALQDESFKKGVAVAMCNGILEYYGVTGNCEVPATRESVEVVLIIDSTGSMGSNDPQKLRIEASKAFIDATQVGDSIAVVDFDSNGVILAPLTLILGDQDREMLKNAVDRIDSSGSTSLNAGLNTGFQVLEASSSPDTPKGAVMLTDGRGSHIDASHLQYADKGWPVYTIGLSSSVDDVVLSKIADDTGGTYTNIANAGDLTSLFFDISQGIANAKIVTNNSILMQNGSTNQLTSQVPARQDIATFFIAWPEDGSTLDSRGAPLENDVSLSLVSPSGQVIDPTTTNADIEYARGRVYELYRIENPENGRWQLNLSANSLPPGDTEVDVRVSVNSSGPSATYLPFLMNEDAAAPATAVPQTPTATVPPASTSTPAVPPTSTSTPAPTNTPLPTVTDTPNPSPTPTYTPTPTNTPAPNWREVEGFESLTNGDINGQNGWNGTDNAAVVNDPADGSNKVLSVHGLAHYASKSLPATIQNSDTGTLFFRMRRDGSVDAAAGLSDVSVPTQWADFEAQFGTDSNSDNFGARDGGTFRTSNQLFRDDTWYCAWLVADNVSNSYEVYLQGGQFSSQTQLTAAALNAFGFRNGGNGALQSFYTRIGVDIGGVLLIDDIYLSEDQENLSAPGPDCSAAALSSWDKVETFSGMDTGNVDGQNGWSGTDNAAVVTDPADTTNKVLSVNGLAHYASKDFPSLIANNQTGTLFFRLRRDGAVDAAAGSADVVNPTQWDDFELQFGTNGSPSNFGVRDEATFRTSEDLFQDDTWYCVWLVASNPSNTYTVYLQGGQFATQTQLTADALNSFGFRNGGSSPLRTFYSRVGVDLGGRLLIDEIYVDNAQQNLSQPLSSCS